MLPTQSKNTFIVVDEYCCVVVVIPQDFLPRIQQKCRASGCCINPVVMSVAEIRAVLVCQDLYYYVKI